MTGDTDRRRAVVERINDQWGTHERGDRTADTHTRCSAFVVDPRYVRADDGEELRLGVSYGDNPFTEEMRGGFVPPPVLPGSHVYGIHVVGTRRDRIAMFDEWFDAREATGRETAAEVEARSRAILAGIPDGEYARVVAEDPSGGEVLRSADRPIEAFEITSAEAM